MNAQTVSDAKYGFGRLIGLARAEPPADSKHGRPVVVVRAAEEVERLRALKIPASVPMRKTKVKG